VRNPIDATIGADLDRLGRALEIVADADNIDLILYSGAERLASPRRTAAVATADRVEAGRKTMEILARIGGERRKPVVCIAHPPVYVEQFEPYQAGLLRAAELGLAVFPAMAQAARAIDRLLRWRERGADTQALAARPTES
jgi:hypothetical protein